MEKITLTNVKYFKAMSEETHCFTATVCLDGERVAIARNQGQGGMTDVNELNGHLLSKETDERIRTAIHEFNKVHRRPCGVCNPMDPRPDCSLCNGSGVYNADDTIEYHLDHLVSLHLIAKDLKRIMKTKILTMRAGEVYETKRLTPDRIANGIALYRKGEYPVEGFVLNALDFAVAVQMFAEPITVDPDTGNVVFNTVEIATRYANV